MALKVGDRVIFVNDTSKGKVIEVFANNELMVEDENGFEYRMKFSEVMKEQGNLRKAMDQIDEYDIRVAANKEVVKKSKLDALIQQAPTYVKYSPDVLEVDLHIENLVDFPKTLENGQIVEIQLKVFERMLETAIEQRKRKVIFIHGVGQGVLRAEIRQILDFYPNVVVQDASYKTYGYGATEVLIKQRG